MILMSPPGVNQWAVGRAMGENALEVFTFWQARHTAWTVHFRFAKYSQAQPSTYTWRATKQVPYPRSA